MSIRRRPRVVRDTALLTLSSLFLSLAICELGLRIVAPQMTCPSQFAHDPALGAIPVPSQVARRTLPGVYAYGYSNDEDGLRVVPQHADRSRCTVLFLGDSFTYGVGVGDDETFSYLAQEGLRAAGFAARAVNAGNSGKGTDYALKFLESRGRRYQPVVVVLLFFQNDFCDNQREEYYSPEPGGELAPKSLDQAFSARKAALGRLPGYDWLLSWSHFANLVRQAGIRLVLVRQGEWHQGAMRRCLDPRTRASTAEYLKRLRRSALDSRAHLHVFYAPSMGDLARFRTRSEQAPEERAVATIASGLGIPFKSLTAELALSQPARGDLYYVEGHWTPLGHRIAAGVITRTLLAQADLPCRQAGSQVSDRAGRHRQSDERGRAVPDMLSTRASTRDICVPEE